jgi:hypothetical protein
MPDEGVDPQLPDRADRAREHEAERLRAAERAARLRGEEDALLRERSRQAGPLQIRARQRRLRRSWSSSSGRVAVVGLLLVAGYVYLQHRSRSSGPSRPAFAVAPLPTLPNLPTSALSNTGATSSGAATSTTITLGGTDRFHPGDCVTWDQSSTLSPDGRPTSIVPCDSAHLGEILGYQEISGLGNAWPGDPVLVQYSHTHCLGPAEQYLGYPLDPAGRFGVAAVLPTQLGWESGQRTMWCDLQLRGSAPTVASFTGSVKGANQSLLFAVGTCLPVASGDPVPCTQPHGTEVTGNVDLTGKTTTWPGSQAQLQALVGGPCGQLAIAYLGGAYPPGVQSGWSDLAATSWAAGRRIVQCIVGKVAFGQWVAITTSLAHPGH